MAKKDDAPSNAENKETLKGEPVDIALSPQEALFRPGEDTGEDAPRAAFTNQPTPATRANLVDNLPPPNPDPVMDPPAPAPRPARQGRPKVDETGVETHVALRRGHAGTLVDRGQFVPAGQPVGDWMVKASEIKKSR